ncbi:MAG TPA: helicase-associated domain-containing protein [Anaerolineae bacterium]|nr:helicase-associated domain-containing protein [Anaerolineae bacterium]
MAGTQRYLIDYPMAMLRAVAEARGLQLPTGRQPEVAGQLAKTMLDTFSVRVALAQLSEGGRLALEALVASGGKMRTPRFGRRFGQVRPVGPGRLEREASWQEPASPAEELVYLGLAFRAFDRDAAGPGEFFLIPDDLLPLLPSPAAEAPCFRVEAVPEPDRPREAGSALVIDLFSYLVHLQLHDVHPFADGRLGRRDLAELRVRLVDADERRLAFLRHLAVRLGFVERSGDLLHLDPAPVKAWLAGAPAAQVQALAEAWRDDPTWNDLRHVPGLAFDDDSGRPLRNDPVAARQAVLSFLARCPRDRWWSVASFASAVRGCEPDFLRPDGDYHAWAIRDVASGEYLAGFESWERVEGALLADLLSGALYWLGIVALGASESGPVCRLTAAGERLLNLVEEEPEAPSALPIQVGPDLRIEVPAPCNLYTRFQLERFADLEGAVPCRYRLTVGALGRAIARGLRVEQILAFLQQASEQRLPANVPGQLRLWAGRYDSVQLEEVVLVRVTGERVMKELQMLPETRSLIEQVITPTTALVRREHLPRLRRELQALGYLRPPREPADD